MSRLTGGRGDPAMPDDRRYLFHGHAVPLGGRIVRIGEGRQAQLIREGFIDLPAGALTAAGGRSTVRIAGNQLESPVARSVVRFERATAFCEGVFDDLKGHFAVTLGERAANTLTATTSVRAEVRGLEVGLASGVRMTIKGVRAGLTSRSGSAGGETPVRLDEETGFDGNAVTFVGERGKIYTLIVDVERDVFHQHDTLSGIAAAASDPKFLRRFGHTLYLSTLAAGRAAPTAPVLVRTDGGAVQGTIVKPLRWKGAAFPGSTIDPGRPNGVFIPGLGGIFFGEITMARQSRRVTMIRASLGSPEGGFLAGVDVQDNGTWS